MNDESDTLYNQHSVCDACDLQARHQQTRWLGEVEGGYFKLGASVPVRDIPGMGGAVIADLYALAPIPGMLAAPNLKCTRLREPVGGMAQIQGILTNHDHG